MSAGNFWSIGMRALHFATPLLMWVFGPIPMFVFCLVSVTVLYSLDWNSSPLLPFEPRERPEIFKKIGQEMTFVDRAIGQETTAVGRAFEHHGRP